MTTILSVRFLGFEYLSMIEDAEKMQIPDHIDHLPPEMISYFLKIQRFGSKDPSRVSSVLS